MTEKFVITLSVVVVALVLPNLDVLQSKARQTIASAAGKGRDQYVRGGFR